MKRNGAYEAAVAFGWCAVMVLAFAVVLGLAFVSEARASEAPAIERVTIPAASYLYRFKLQREVFARFGSQDDVARIAAQVHKESLWRANARSTYAEGMAQFTPSTGRWLVRDVCPEIGPPDPWSPNWSMRAIVCYDHWLHARVADAATPCDRWAMTLSSYNGGLRNLQRDQRRASANGADPARWFEHVERFSARAHWAFAENRDYVRKILLALEPAYLAAGWPGAAACP